jgi:hypothetical protein
MKYHAPVPAAGLAAAAGVADAAGAALAAVAVDFSVCSPPAIVSTAVAELVGVAVFGEALTPEAVRGATDDCLVKGRLRAGPAVPVAPVDFEGVPASLAEASLAELPLDAESDEPLSGAASATP